MVNKITNFLKRSIKNLKPIAKKSVKYFLFLAIILLEINASYAEDLSLQQRNRGFIGILFDKPYYEFSKDPEINEIWLEGERKKEHLSRHSRKTMSRFVEEFNFQIKSRLLTKRQKIFLKIEHWKVTDMLRDDESLARLDIDHETRAKIEKVMKQNIKKNKNKNK